MAKVSEVKYEPILASPVKSFFVTMLTRDISLADAILDLLDNCVDGVLRSGKKAGDKPYRGFWAEISFKEDSFSIADNCGGIPWDLHSYAFRMGRASNRPKDAPGTVGVYGIGMKRAIFKIGKNSLISTRNGKDQYEIEIPPSWLENENDWVLPVRAGRTAMKEDGTTIVVGDLYPGIAKLFGEDAPVFKSDLEGMISEHYAYIIDKGFEVRVNGDPVKPRVAKLIFDSGGPDVKEAIIRPFIFKTKTDDGVEVFLTVGFTRPIPSQAEIEDEQVEKRYSSEDAGWTILCNDRAVVYNDRSELTGWGEAGVPRYHTQFIAISGIVEFKAADASKLPTTTTKRGIDASLPLYLQVKNKMREGMRIFTDYTNKWKGRADESKVQIQKGKPLSLNEIKAEAERIRFSSTVRSFPPGEQYRPPLPMPTRLEPTKRRISFVKEVKDIKIAAGYFDDPDMEPSEVGEKCFDIILTEARK